jgi:dienelactone hydrolase
LRERVQEVLGPFPNPVPFQDRILKQSVYQGIFLERVVFESEPGITIPAIFLAPTEWRKPIPPVIYVDELGKEAGFENGAIQALLEAGLAVLAVDVRGTGESAASDFEAATNALMSDRPLFGQRVWDVLRSVECLWNRVYVGLQVDKGRIACLGRGWGGLLALYAAALDERIAAAALWEAPCTYHDLLVERPAFPASVYLFGVLRRFDLPDLIDEIAPRPLLLAEPVDGCRNPLELDETFHKDHLLSRLANARLTIYPHASPQAETQGIAAWIKENTAR